MSFYVDSADYSVISDLWPSGAFAGVTTNPTILTRAGLGQEDLPQLCRRLVDEGVPRIYAQVVGRTAQSMVDAAHELRALGPIVVKVPADASGIDAARQLVASGAEVLLTAVYHPTQAMVARDIGVQEVAPYVGRMADEGRGGVEAVAMMQRAIGSAPTRILAASLRSLDDVATLGAAGVPDFALGEHLARSLVRDPLTQQAVADFEVDAGRASS